MLRCRTCARRVYVLVDYWWDQYSLHWGFFKREREIVKTGLNSDLECRCADYGVDVWVTQSWEPIDAIILVLVVCVRYNSQEERKVFVAGVCDRPGLGVVVDFRWAVENACWAERSACVLCKLTCDESSADFPYISKYDARSSEGVVRTREESIRVLVCPEYQKYGTVWRHTAMCGDGESRDVAEWHLERSVWEVGA